MTGSEGRRDTDRNTVQAARVRCRLHPAVVARGAAARCGPYSAPRASPCSRAGGSVNRTHGQRRCGPHPAATHTAHHRPRAHRWPHNPTPRVPHRRQSRRIARRSFDTAQLIENLIERGRRDAGCPYPPTRDVVRVQRRAWRVHARGPLRFDRPRPHPAPSGRSSERAPRHTREAPSVRRSILVTGRDVAFEQLGKLLDGDLHGAEQGITLHGGAGDGPAETFCEVGIQRIRHDGQVCSTTGRSPARFPHPHACPLKKHQFRPLGSRHTTICLTP